MSSPSENQNSLSILQGNSFANSKNTSIMENTSFEVQVYKFKVILLGDPAVGKTSLCIQFTDNSFSPNYKCTINAELKVKTISLDKTTMAELKLWDTCGQEKFRSMTRNYYNDTDGVLLLYDITKRSSFEHLSTWIDDLREYADSNTEIILVGNKSDLEDEREVTKEEIKNFSIKHKTNFVEVSAKNGTNVVLLFEKLVNQMMVKKKVKDDLKEGKERLYYKKPSLMQMNMDLANEQKKTGCC